jgi:hypothetical protein
MPELPTGRGDRSQSLIKIIVSCDPENSEHLDDLLLSVQQFMDENHPTVGAAVAGRYELEPDRGDEHAQAARECGTCDGSGVYREPVEGVQTEMESTCPECGPVLSAPLSRALDAFVAAYGRRITWAEVLPIVAHASGLEPEYELCGKCQGLGDRFNGGWRRTPCPSCNATGKLGLRGYAVLSQQQQPAPAIQVGAGLMGPPIGPQPPVERMPLADRIRPDIAPPSFPPCALPDEPVAPQEQTQRPTDALGHPLCFTCGKPQGDHRDGIECQPQEQTEPRANELNELLTKLAGKHSMAFTHERDELCIRAKRLLRHIGDAPGPPTQHRLSVRPHGISIEATCECGAWRRVFARPADAEKVVARSR